MVLSRAKNSVGASGGGSGSQRSWSGVTGSWPNELLKRGCSNGSNVPCIAAGRIRYSQLRRFWPRGAVNAVPDSCSAYSPCATLCGELRPCGSAPGTASVRSEEHTSELQSLKRNSYAVFCLKKKKTQS